CVQQDGNAGSELHDQSGLVALSLPRRSGRNHVRSPIKGRNEQAKNTNSTLVASASLPSTAEPIPARPKANPKKRPAMSPTFPGTSSMAYTRIAGNADAIIAPMTIESSEIQNKSAYGRMRVNGATPRIDSQMTCLRPIRSDRKSVV